MVPVVEAADVSDSRSTNPDRLAAQDLTLRQVFEAVEKNNANSSGGYIQHKSTQWVVRGLGLVKSTDDIANIVIASHNSTPVFVRDVAEVQIGSEVRQGAVQMNTKGEVVSGIVMMLIQLGRRTVPIIQANIAFALGG